MIRLHPQPDARHSCPACGRPLLVRGWYIPGMRNLADLQCDGCQRSFYGDLPAAGALYYTMLLDCETGEVHDPHQVRWFAGWLRDGYARRVSDPIGFEFEERRPVRRPVLLNCLDALYGHGLLKLLNAQFYLDRCLDRDLIVLVPRFLRWLVPDNVPAVWTVDLPLSRGTEWNDWLAVELHRRLEPFAECRLSTALSHPHPDDFDIRRFTGVEPFPVEQWDLRLARPTVTFIWREDRCWPPSDDGDAGAASRERQTANVARFAELLRQKWPALDFAVAGFGPAGGLPDWIEDLRAAAIDERLERQWCRRYALSHLAVGVHGSNLLLPSAHAGATISLTPFDRWSNVTQDLLYRPCEAREAAFCYRAVPDSATPEELACIANAVLHSYGEMSTLTWTDACRHRPRTEAQAQARA